MNSISLASRGHWLSFTMLFCAMGLANPPLARSSRSCLDDSDMEAAHTKAWPAAGAVERIEKSTAHAQSGERSLHVVTGSSKWGGIRKVVTGLRPGATYRLSYWARRVRGDARIDVSVGDGTRWAGVFGGHRLGASRIWWPGSAYIRLRDPSETTANPKGQLGAVSQIRIQFRRGPGGAAEFYLDDVQLREWDDPLAMNQIQNGSFEQSDDRPEGWQTTGEAVRCPTFAAEGKACTRLGRGGRIQQRVQLSARTWYTLCYEWTTPRRGRVRVGLSYDEPGGKRHLDLRTATGTERPYLVSPYRQGGFARRFARTGVTYRTADHAGHYSVIFDNTGPDDAYLDSVMLAPSEPASARWASFDIPYDGDGSVTGRPLRDMAGFLGEGPRSLDDVRKRRTPVDRDGFIRVGPDSHFVNGRGERVRFYAVNMPGMFAMPKTMDDARRIANRLAKLGVNLVRIHGADYKLKSWAKDRPGLFGPPSWKPGTTELYPESLRQLDSFLAQCKAHGIYVQLDLMTSRTFMPADGVADLDALRRLSSWHTTRLFVTSYDRRLIELQKRFQTQLLSHVNEYTGLRYADDPVIASVELKNEEGLLYCGFGRAMYKGHPPHYQKQLAERWNQWLQTRYADTAALRQAWLEDSRIGLRDDERLSAVAFAPELRDMQSYSQARYADMVRFISQLVGVYQDDMVAHLRGLGVKCPIRDTQAQSRPCRLRAQSCMDYVDAHSYWAAPFDRAMVHSAGGNMIGPSFIAVDGKPMSVSEYNSFSGHKYRAEMPILFAAYAAFQDWDCITLHSYGGASGRIDSMALAFHYIASYGDSPLVAQFPVAARIFRNGLVRSGRRTVELRYTKEQCDSGQPSETVPPEIALTHRIRAVDLTAENATASETWRPPTPPYASDTNELRWDTANGLVTIETPQVEAAIGFVGGKTIRLKHLTLRSRTPFAAVSLVARDGRSLSESSSVLLTAAAQAENTAMTWDHDRTAVLNYGYAPVVCERVLADVELRGTKHVRVFALGPDGRRGAAVPVLRDNGVLSFRLDPSLATLWYEAVSPR